MMNTYVNGFRCSMKDDGAELVLQFTQSSPEYDENGKGCGIATEIASSLVMQPSFAEQLAKSVLELIEKTAPQESE